MITVDDWKPVARKNIRSMRADEIEAFLTSRGGRVVGVGDPKIREITGGYASQSIDFEVCRMMGERLRKLKEPAIAEADRKVCR